jgi:hypothetical protein
MWQYDGRSLPRSKKRITSSSSWITFNSIIIVCSTGIRIMCIASNAATIGNRPGSKASGASIGTKSSATGPPPG